MQDLIRITCLITNITLHVYKISQFFFWSYSDVFMFNNSKKHFQPSASEIKIHHKTVYNSFNFNKHYKNSETKTISLHTA